MSKYHAGSNEKNTFLWCQLLNCFVHARAVKVMTLNSFTAVCGATSQPKKINSLAPTFIPQLPANIKGKEIDYPRRI